MSITIASITITKTIGSIRAKYIELGLPYKVIKKVKSIKKARKKKHKESKKRKYEKRKKRRRYGYS